MALDDQQLRNIYATVEAMVNAAAEVMQRIRPAEHVRGWNELTPTEQDRLAQAWHPSLAPLGQILTGRVVKDAPTV